MIKTIKRTTLIFTLLILLFGGYKTIIAQDDSKKTPEQHRLHEVTEKNKEAKEEQSDSIHDRLKKAAKTTTTASVLYLLLLAFLAGLVTSMTPCVYPMIPITIGVLQASGEKTLSRNLMSASSYVLGIATVYSILGYMSAKASLMFGQWVANPWIIGFVILFFLYLAFSMFGFYEVYVPKFLSRRGDVQTKGSLLKTFTFGLISGTVASPCLTPALAVLLAVVAKQGNPIVGFLTMFLFSIGMGALLIVIGTFSGALSMLPRAGTWMIQIKKGMGFMMLAACVYFLQTFISSTTAFIAYGAISLLAGIYFLVEKNRNKITMLVGLLLTGLSGWLFWMVFKTMM